ncbi:hypothetical protein [Saccharibacillus qingshengii]|uniref:hypothetical protein n=1 Tax=Saccharibacillus qingshengii TaxID=1763540 RepID=UPI0015536B31|nr:hypothetical protein [Saccharibacillus qingshengii]
MKKNARMISLASALLLTFALTACGEAKAPAPEPEEIPTNTTPVTPDTAAPDETDVQEHDVISATGEYGGQADPHTIEVTMDGSPTSFQVSESAAAQLEGLSEGDTISFEYMEHPVEGSDTPQLEIQSLKKTRDSAAQGATGTTEGEKETSERPATETFTVGDGVAETAVGTLQQGDGYSLYVLDGYKLEASSGRLVMTANPDYYAEIEKLPADFDLDKLRSEGTAELAKSGAKVDEFFSDTLVESPMVNAALFLQGSGEKELRDYIVWKARDESAYLFRLVMPESEEGSPFYMEATTSLSTILGEK